MQQNITDNNNGTRETNIASPSRGEGIYMKMAEIVQAVFPVGAISIPVLWILVRVYKRRNHRVKSLEDAERWENTVNLAPDSPVRFTYETLKNATSNFDEHMKLGGGGFGSVFKGRLNDGTRIAVKRLDDGGQGSKEFVAEVRTIGSIHHVNLVKLVGFCAEKTHRLLVYEYMSSGSLDKWIFGTNPRGTLPWDAKKKIILQIAKGLAYLHEECQMRIAHLDVKPQNVLPDNGFNAKLSDFGLAKLIDRDQNFVMTQIRGTRGYLAPEWLSRKITEKDDIYSYGIVVLEVVFGRKNLDSSQPEKSTLLVHLVKKKLEASQLSDLLENTIENINQNVEDMEKTIKLAVWCLHTEPARRPTMSMVIRVLEGATAMEDISDDPLIFLAMDGNPAIEATTQISASVLFGPR